ncbi:MAG: hypothetical protein Q9M36_04655 [Sulfurovum sp.]|nr:hypothetical protein [Sulfurovum sp.]
MTQSTNSALVLTLSCLLLSACTPAIDMHNTGNTSNTSYNTTHTQSTTPIPTSDLQPTPAKMAIYKKTMNSIGEDIENDMEYERIEFATADEKKWFRTLTYRLWDRQMTRHQFLAEGLAKYPSHSYEFQFIINHFTQYGSTEGL